MTGYQSPPSYYSGSGTAQPHPLSLDKAHTAFGASAAQAHDADNDTRVDASSVEPAMGNARGMVRSSSPTSSKGETESLPPAYENPHVGQSGGIASVCVTDSASPEHNLTSYSNHNSKCNDTQVAQGAALQNALCMLANNNAPTSSVELSDVSAVGHVPHVYYQSHYGTSGASSPNNRPVAAMQHHRRHHQPPAFTASSSAYSHTATSSGDLSMAATMVSGSVGAAASKNTNTVSCMHLSFVGKFGVANGQCTQTMTGELRGEMNGGGQVSSPLVNYSTRADASINNNSGNDMAARPVPDSAVTTGDHSHQDRSMGQWTSPLSRTDALTGSGLAKTDICVHNDPQRSLERAAGYGGSGDVVREQDRMDSTAHRVAVNTLFDLPGSRAVHMASAYTAAGSRSAGVHAAHASAAESVGSAVGTQEQRDEKQHHAQTLSLDSFLHPSLTQVDAVSSAVATESSSSPLQEQQQQQHEQQQQQELTLQLHLPLGALSVNEGLPTRQDMGDTGDGKDESPRCMNFPLDQLAVGLNNNNQNSEQSCVAEESGSLAYVFSTSPMRAVVHHHISFAGVNTTTSNSNNNNNSTVARSSEDTTSEQNMVRAASLQADALLPPPPPPPPPLCHRFSENTPGRDNVHELVDARPGFDGGLSAHFASATRPILVHSNNNNDNHAYLANPAHMSYARIGGAGDYSSAPLTMAAGAMVDTMMTIPTVHGGMPGAGVVTTVSSSPSALAAAAAPPSSPPSTCVSRNSASPCTAVTEPVVDVYDPEFKGLLSIPESQIIHRPHPSFGVSRYVLCRNFSLDKGAASCSKGEMCKFVHADIRGATRCSIHVNYVWRSLELCTYPRLPAGDELVVFAPNERQPSETIRSERVLVTRGSMDWKEHGTPLSHCAHYYFNRMCNRGERCNFIHAVHVDPTVQSSFKRAPAPTAVAPILLDKSSGHLTAVLANTPAPHELSRSHAGSPSHGGYQVLSAPHTPTPGSRSTSPNTMHANYLSSAFTGSKMLTPSHAPTLHRRHPPVSSASPSQTPLPVTTAPACFAVVPPLHTNSTASMGSNGSPVSGVHSMLHTSVPTTAASGGTTASLVMSANPAPPPDCVSPYMMLVNNHPAGAPEAATMSVFPMGATVPTSMCASSGNNININHSPNNAAAAAAGTSAMLTPFAVVPTSSSSVMPTAGMGVGGVAAGGMYSHAMGHSSSVAGAGVALLDPRTTTTTTTTTAAGYAGDSAMAMTAPRSTPSSHSTQASPVSVYGSTLPAYVSGGVGVGGNVYLTVPSSIRVAGASSTASCTSPLGPLSRSGSSQSMNELDWSFYSNLDNSAWQSNACEVRHSLK